MQQIYCLEEELLEALEDKITGAGYSYQNQEEIDKVKEKNY